MTADIFSGAIDVMFLLVPFLVAVLWVKWFGEFLNAAAKKQKRRAAAFAFPIFAPALLIIGYSVYASYFPNDSESKKVFFSVFKTQPNAQIYNLKGQDLSREEEQEEPTFLSFQASAETIVKLTDKKFTLLSPKQRNLCTIENWETPPS